MISPANPQTKVEYLWTFSGHLMPLMLGGIKLDTHVAGHFNRFSYKRYENEVWVGVIFHDP